MHQNRSHHHHGTAKGRFTAKKWFGHRAGRSPCAHSIGKLFLCYIVLFSSETSAPGSPGNYLYSSLKVVGSHAHQAHSPTWTSWHWWPNQRLTKAWSMQQFGLELALEMLENNRSKEQTGNEKSLRILYFHVYTYIYIHTYTYIHIIHS